MNIYRECFKNLTPQKASCASMCESMIAYFDGLGSYSDKRYLTPYRESLGDKRVEEIYCTLKAFINEKCEVKTGVFTDDEGVTYNSIGWR